LWALAQISELDIVTRVRNCVYLKQLKRRIILTKIMAHLIQLQFKNFPT
jgi:anti-sigma factor ChrR (cupin superfamily)